METVSRNTCYLKILDGATNLINFKLKAQALYLARTVSLSNSPCDSSFFLCKYFAGRLMSSLRPTWAHLRDNSSPSAALPSPFYRSCLVTLSAVGNCDVTAKALYSKLLSIGSSPPILHRQWAQVIGPGFSLNCHWSLVREIFLQRILKMICCGSLPYVQLKFAIGYRIGELAAPAPVPRVLCERRLAIVF